LESFEQGHAERISGLSTEAGASAIPVGVIDGNSLRFLCVLGVSAVNVFGGCSPQDADCREDFRESISLFAYLPKNPGSIKYQLINPASIPIAVTTSTIIFSLVVVGLPAIEGTIKRKKPPTPMTGENAASFIE